jgi:hypothetical protein
VPVSVKSNYAGIGLVGIYFDILLALLRKVRFK